MMVVCIEMSGMVWFCVEMSIMHVVWWLSKLKDPNGIIAFPGTVNFNNKYI
jgi:hypothetical protein